MIPPGESKSILWTITQSRSFHNDPNAFITTRLRKYESSIIRVNLLYRDIAIVSRYEDVRNLFLLEGASSTGYEDLIADFFKQPNLLLQDRETGEWKAWRREWEQIITEIDVSSIPSIIHDGLCDGDIYRTMKNLSQRLIDHMFGIQTQSLQKDIFRGQFSIPVGVNTRIFQSGRSRGLAAVETLHKQISQNLGSCPYLQRTTLPEENQSRHVLMFTSSLVVKAVASLLSATVLHLSDKRLLKHIHSSADPQSILRSIMLECERLSPPIIGCVRRATRPVRLGGVEIPQGWDLWSYFVAANRDAAIYSSPDTFQYDRFLSDIPEPLTFGYGAKHCLGRELVRGIVMEVLSQVSVCGISHTPLSRDVQYWLGLSPIQASGIKQLPTQRPRLPITVSFTNT